MRRDTFLSSALATATIFSVGGTALAAANPAQRIRALERSTGGRLGFFALDSGSGRTMTHRAHERFPMCSTFKLLAAAAILSRVDHGKEHLARRILYTKSDLLDAGERGASIEALTEGLRALNPIAISTTPWDSRSRSMMAKSPTSAYRRHSSLRDFAPSSVRSRSELYSPTAHSPIRRFGIPPGGWWTPHQFSQRSTAALHGRGSRDRRPPRSDFQSARRWRGSTRSTPDPRGVSGWRSSRARSANGIANCAPVFGYF